MEKVKIVRRMNLFTLASRLSRRNAFHIDALDAIDDEILKMQKEKLARKPAHTNNVGDALKSAFTKSSVERRQKRHV